MDRTEKTELGNALKEKFLKVRVALFADYKGLTATQADDLRRKLRERQVEVKVLKNTIAVQAAKDGALGVEAKKLLEDLVGPTLVAFAYGDPAQAAKVIHQFSEENEALKLKESLMGQKVLQIAEIVELAKLPAHEILLAKLLGTFNAPTQNFVGVLAAVPRSFLNVLTAVEQKKAKTD